MSKRWKAVELEICRLFGGERSGPVGKMGPDCINTDPYSIQIKHRSVPQWLTDAVTQSVNDAPRTSNLPIVVLHPKGRGIKESLVIIMLDDFLDWYVS